ncbi:unnamed protein product [Danaus chrysippus]|uniref:Hexosyltransferase n=1 Tax=Danaus chrysippus TaxID=151541 RepID=A0A8J2QU37_9NEOP|nr:unnamed protein product [Danaus chrysippus]
MLSRYVVSQVKHNSYFLVGLGIGLWLALATVPLEEDVVSCEDSTAAALDEFEPQREERPPGAAGPAGRTVTRPRYYSTELGMRAALLAGVLSSEAALESRAAALNQTAAGLQPALRFFITASALQGAPGRANVVGFTDTREMLKPFHALKYLADNFLEEYDFFFLVSDATFVNARRLNQLVSSLSVSQDVYMGAVSADDPHYCSLEAGLLLSNSVLRAVHEQLDWCVRNSYSPHHHENLGRCVLHAAGLRCVAGLQAASYDTAPLPPAGARLHPSLADAVTLHPALTPDDFYRLHAYVSRVNLERVREEEARTRLEAALSSRHHPPGYRNVSWPSALRADAGLAPPPPPTRCPAPPPSPAPPPPHPASLTTLRRVSRFDLLRWTRFNLTHALQFDDHRAVSKLSASYKQAVDLIVEEVRAWVGRRWGGGAEGGAASVELEEGAWCWEPPRALRYRLLLRVTGEGGGRLVQVEAARALGAARLAPAPYVTESARVHVVLAAPDQRTQLAAFLERYEAVCLQRDGNTALYVVVIPASDGGRLTEDERAHVEELREMLRTVGEKHRARQHVDVLVSGIGRGEGQGGGLCGAGERARRDVRLALRAALGRAPKDALLLVGEHSMEFTEDFLNRVRMNTVAGSQWFSPLPFGRFSQYAHPLFVEADGSRPSLHTGRFTHSELLSVYNTDYTEALRVWLEAGGSEEASPSEVLAASPLRVLRAPEPALLLPPRPRPCSPAPSPSEERACLVRERERGFSDLLLGARQSLAKLLLQTQAELQ